MLYVVSVLSTRPSPNGLLPVPSIFCIRNVRFPLSVLGTFVFMGR